MKSVKNEFPNPHQPGVMITLSPAVFILRSTKKRLWSIQTRLFFQRDMFWNAMAYQQWFSLVSGGCCYG